ncbi:hypothetical protein Tco_0975277 [Tanacetum coccineum]|uniref:Uncharacterized protein n=1 Tax=Tanacetum coccineum TaxID=301880 RepID=A0ABQ5EDX8_9ASTR
MITLTYWPLKAYDNRTLAIRTINQDFLTFLGNRAFTSDTDKVSSTSVTMCTLSTGEMPSLPAQSDYFESMQSD